MKDVYRIVPMGRGFAVQIRRPFLGVFTLWEHMSDLPIEFDTVDLAVQALQERERRLADYKEAQRNDLLDKPFIIATMNRKPYTVD